jgi:hypothetical protein
MNMRMHLHLEDAAVTAVDLIDSGSPFVAVMIRGGSILLRDGAAEIKSPVELTQAYLPPETARALALAILAALPERALEMAS